jgi:hypothetical protein
VTRVGGERSTTKDIYEFRIPIPVDELGIQNSELRIIDTPGLGDSRGLDEDAKSLATLEEFLDGHKELSTRIPNVILVFHKFTDNRYNGQGSAFVKMLRGLDEFRPRITDKNYSNVIFVFSHFMSETKAVTRNPKKKLAALKKVIKYNSQFPLPIVIAVAENRATDHTLPMVNGYYKLPNGDYYPKNLFDRITQITSGAQDVIGEAIIRTAFRDPDDFKVTSTDFPLVDPNNNKVPKFFGILAGAVYNVAQTGVPPPKSSTLLPGEDRGNTAHLQTTSMFSSVLEKVMEESRKSDERFQKMMERMQEQQIRMEERFDNLSHVISSFLQRLPRPSY